jgi:hypothetical protein
MPKPIVCVIRFAQLNMAGLDNLKLAAQRVDVAA